MKTVISTGGAVGLAERIIDVFFHAVSSGRGGRGRGGWRDGGGRSQAWGNRSDWKNKKSHHQAHYKNDKKDSKDESNPVLKMFREHAR